MKHLKCFCLACLLASGVCFGTMKAEEIVLQDLYEISPLDNPEEEWDMGSRPKGITANITDGIVQVDFQKPMGNAQIVISRSDGTLFQQRSELNPQSMTIDMNGAEAGRYLLEVYTDTEAVGGVFEVK